MNLTEVLSAAKKAGITFYLEDNKLAFKAPKGAFTPELKKCVLSVKEELIELLSQLLSSNSGPKVLELNRAPLSRQQTSQFALYARAPKASTYHIVMPIKVDKKVSTQQLVECLGLLLEKHAAFKTKIEISAEGYQSRQYNMKKQNVNDGQKIAIEIPLVAGEPLNIEGLILDKTTKKPIGNATVDLINITNKTTRILCMLLDNHLKLL